METIKFKKARDFVDSICKEKKILISADDPVQMLLRVIDENLKHVFEIAIADYKETKKQLNEKEQNAILNRNFGELNCISLTEHQKFLLSIEYGQSIANYLQRKFNKELETKSLLRLNGKVDFLPKNALPKYDIDPTRGVYHFNDIGDEVVFVTGKNRVHMPLFEINKLIQKDYESIWDIKIDDFIMGCEEIIKVENELYEKIIKKIGDGDNEKTIIIPVMNSVENSSLTVLPCMDWINKKAGYCVFEILGIGVIL